MMKVAYILAFIVRRDTQVVDGTQSEHKLALHVMEAPSKEAALGRAVLKVLNAYQGYGIYAVLDTEFQYDEGIRPGFVEVPEAALKVVYRPFG
mgnify:CR=1 FL=1